MEFRNLPVDINAEVLLDYYPRETFDVEFRGHHKRNAYKDVLELDDRDDRVLMALARNSLYHSLPEYLFHPIDRFDLPQLDKEERFKEECDLQEMERTNAIRFFAPLDLMLLQQRLRVRHAVQELTSDNKVLIDILADNLSEEQRENRFIRRSLPYLPYCKIIRGDRTLITLMMRRVLHEERITIDVGDDARAYIDTPPRYPTEVEAQLGDLYLGTGYEQMTLCYDVHYWSDEECDEHFNLFLNELEVYRAFVQDFFLSVEAVLTFDVHDDAPPLRLSDTTIYNYLNYNTNI